MEAPSANLMLAGSLAVLAGARLAALSTLHLTALAACYILAALTVVHFISYNAILISYTAKQKFNKRQISRARFNSALQRIKMTLPILHRQQFRGRIVL
jgi:hypothetical protein